MHGLIFETSICYWQDQPVNCRVMSRIRIRHPPSRFPRHANKFATSLSTNFQGGWFVSGAVSLLPTPLHNSLGGANGDGASAHHAGVRRHKALLKNKPFKSSSDVLSRLHDLQRTAVHNIRYRRLGN